MISEHFEEDVNEVLPSVIVLQQLLLSPLTASGGESLKPLQERTHNTGVL